MTKLLRIIKFIFRVDFFSYILFIHKVISHWKITLPIKNSNNKYLLKKVMFLQSHLDKINRNLPNDITLSINKEINENQKLYKGFNAQIDKSKHGIKNDGISINFDKDGWNANFTVGL